MNIYDEYPPDVKRISNLRYPRWRPKWPPRGARWPREAGHSCAYYLCISAPPSTRCIPVCCTKSFLWLDRCRSVSVHVATELPARPVIARIESLRSLNLSQPTSGLHRGVCFYQCYIHHLHKLPPPTMQRCWASSPNNNEVHYHDNIEQLVKGPVSLRIWNSMW